MNKIAVIGSFGQDMIMQVSHIPARGETVGEGRFSQTFGGKGANQALASAKSGADVVFVSMVGEDSAGDTAISSFTAHGINTDFMTQTDAIGTGTALIFVGDDGENSITVAPGANYHLKQPHVDAAEAVLKKTKLILMQLEIPMETVEYVLHKAETWKVPVLLNPAPAKPLSDIALQRIHTLVVNETEAEIVSGETLEGADSVARIALSLRAKGPEVVIVTLGADGAYVSSDGFTGLVPGNKVDVVDTTAAGDVFCGALSTALCSDLSLEEAIKFANVAAAIAVTRLGAQPSVPHQTEIEEFIASLTS
ncbi:MAG: ribokinase [Gammaproteobacteria bacterium]|nr:MAG: ribokinase [Gammaproteobacteria bacterium]PCJ46886.1 MAG: ribokinase [Gammaproteobacteria bacterium]